MLAAVDVNRSDGKYVHWLGNRRGHASKNGADAQHELLRAERLREIIVGT